MKKCFYIFSSLLLFLMLFNKGFGQVKPETIRQIQSLLQEKESRTPAQKKMGSQLLQAVREYRGEQMAANVQLEPANVSTDNRGLVKVDISAKVNDALLARIKALGGQIIFPSKEYGSIRASVPFEVAEKIAADPDVKFIQPAVPYLLSGSGNGKKNPRLGSQLVTMPSRNPISHKNLPSFKKRADKIRSQIQNYVMTLGTGTINTQGDHAHRADDARNAYGYAGAGIKVGVLSDSYNALGTASADVATGNLPGVGNPFGNTTPVTVIQDYTGGEDEGRAMLNIVHDIVPKAQLYFATADAGGPAGFAANIIALRAAGCDVIIDDVFYYNEAVFQDGPIAQAVNTVTAAGAMYFSSAGNSGALAKGTSGVWEGDFSDATDTGTLKATFTTTKSGSIHNFGTRSAPIAGDIVTLAASGGYTMGWADPIGASTNDYDLFLVSAAGVVKGSSTTVQNGTQDPYEFITTATLVAGDRLVVFKTATAAVRAISVNSNRGTLTIATTGQTHGHACAANAYCVAAAPAAAAFGTGYPTGPYPGIYTAANKLELFSSDGPRKIFFNADGTPVTAGNFLFGTNGGTIRNKPDITGADGVATTLPAGSGLNPFYGTSAAAPHAGAIAALIKSASSSLTNAQIRTILTTTALDIETAGYDINSGFGIVQAYQAMQAVAPTPMSNIALGTNSVSEGSFSNGNGSIDPGELGKLLVQLVNPSMATATGVTATLTTTTPGITITAATASYGNIVAGGSANNTANPFVFAVNQSVVCGTVINFYLTVSFGNSAASTQGFTFTVTTGGAAAGPITSNLGAPPPTGSGFTSTTGRFTTARLNRNTPVSSCGVQKVTPILTSTVGTRIYDAYVFKNTNTTNQCVTVTLTATNGINLYLVAYNSTGFVPTNPAANFLADQGSSAATQTFSFTDTASKPFTLVIYNITPGSDSGSTYTLNVSLSNCAAAPACNPIVIAPAALSNGTSGSPYSQLFTATGGSGSSSFTFSLAGNLPAGLTFSGNTLSGTPTQAGSFPITITATDPTGCTFSQSYTLTITGIAPATVVATAGTPQISSPLSSFPIPLKARVLSIVNAPLKGVNIIFTAPTTGAGGTFANGTNTVTVVSDSLGIATAPLFTANATAGAFTVTATAVGVAVPASFTLVSYCSASYVVTSNADSGPGTLRDIINNGCAGITISFDPSITQIALTSGEIAITKAVTIIGSGANVLTVSGSNLSRIFNISAGIATVNIAGLTLSNAKIPATSTLGGGAILVNNGASIGAVNIANCVITNNDVSLPANSLGGAIDNEGGTVTIDRSTLSNNITTYRGGAIQNQGYGTMTITNSTIFGNTAGVAGIGGAIRSFLPLTFANCTVYGNSALSGGNISVAGGTATIGNSIVAGGTLLSTGGTGPDIGGTIVSNDFNLISNTAGSTITGTTTNNITGVSAKLLPLANYGGATTTLLPMSNSPVINAGDATLLTGMDQRGNPRMVGGRTDIGSVETNYVAAILSGTPQTAAITKPFAAILQTNVKESGNNIAGDTVLFTAPTTGQSGTFPGNHNIDTAITDANGNAGTPLFTANAITGTYNVASAIGNTFPVLNFVLTNGTATPVTFGAITANVVNCTAQLQWETLTELNSKDFTVEYSTDGLHFVALVTVPAKGNSTTKQTYRYIHTSLAQGTNYYRIKQTDLDGAFTYSSTVIVASDCNNVPIVAYPNPVQNNLTVVIPGTDKRTITVTDATGRRINQYIVNGGTQVINASSWAKGMYSLTITKDGALSFVMKVIKD